MLFGGRRPLPLPLLVVPCPPPSLLATLGKRGRYNRRVVVFELLQAGWGLGFRVQGSGFEVRGLGLGFRVKGVGFRVLMSRFGILISGYRVSMSGFRVLTSGSRVSISGLRLRVLSGWGAGQRVCQCGLT